MTNAVLDNAYAPITFSYGFVQSPFAQISDAFIAWRKEIDAKFGTQTEVCRFGAPLPKALLSLEPLTTPLDRYLLIETRSAWTAVFSNGLRANDVHSPVSYLSTVLNSQGLEVACVPDRSDRNAKDGLRIYGAIAFTLYGFEKTDRLNRIRHVAVTNDVGGWEFAADGEVQPYEQTENYQKRNVVDRFNVEMLESYCAALGIELFDSDFYGGQCLVSHIKRAAAPGPSMSISEARSHLYL
jgi:hypothetical protein